MAVAVNQNPKAFDCETCRQRYCDPATPAPFDVWELEGIGPMRVCPKPQITPDSRRFLQLYRFYQQNLLAFAGPVTDQPEPYLLAMQLIHNLVIMSRSADEQHR